MSSTQDNQERQDIDGWLRWACTTLGVFLIVAVLIVCCLHIVDKEKYPAPVDIEAGLLFGLGILLIAIFNFPWTKIRLGDIEIERAIEKETREHAEEIVGLRETILKYEAILDEIKEVPTEIRSKIDSSKNEREHENEDEELLLNFLNYWSSWGFTVSRICNWGGKRPGFGRFSKLNGSQVRSLAGNLVRKDRIRTRISSNGNVLYQSKIA
jgi:hypothetical protein